MLTSKQRAYLRSIAQTEPAIFQVGKSGLGEEIISALDKAIEKRELIKITVLQNADGEIEEIGKEIAEKLDAEFVCKTGRKLVLYRKSKDEKNVRIIL